MGKSDECAAAGFLCMTEVGPTVGSARFRSCSRDDCGRAQAGGLCSGFSTAVFGIMVFRGFGRHSAVGGAISRRGGPGRVGGHPGRWQRRRECGEFSFLNRGLSAGRHGSGGGRHAPHLISREFPGGLYRGRARCIFSVCPESVIAEGIHLFLPNQK